MTSEKVKIVQKAQKTIYLLVSRRIFWLQMGIMRVIDIKFFWFSNVFILNKTASMKLKACKKPVVPYILLNYSFFSAV